MGGYPPGLLSPLVFVSLGYCPLGFCPPGLLSPWAFVPLGFCPPGLLSPWVFVFLGFCPLGYCPMGFCPLGFCPDTRTLCCAVMEEWRLAKQTVSDKLQINDLLLLLSTTDGLRNIHVFRIMQNVQEKFVN